MMNEQQNIDLVRGAYEAFGRGDIEGVLSRFDENIEWYSPGPADVPTAGLRRGRQQVGEFFGVLDELFEFDRFEAQTFISQGDHVVVLGEEDYRLKGTNKAISAQWAHVCVVRNGKVTSFREYTDVSALVEALRGATVKA